MATTTCEACDGIGDAFHTHEHLDGERCTGFSCGSECPECGGSGRRELTAAEIEDEKSTRRFEEAYQEGE